MTRTIHLTSIRLCSALVLGCTVSLVAAEAPESDSAVTGEREVQSEPKATAAEARVSSETPSSETTDEKSAEETVEGNTTSGGGGGGGGGSATVGETPAPARSRDEDDFVASSLDSAFWNPWIPGGAGGGGQVQNESDGGGEVLGVASASKKRTRHASTVYVSVPQSADEPAPVDGNVDGGTTTTGGVLTIGSGSGSYGGLLTVWNNSNPGSSSQWLNGTSDTGSHATNQLTSIQFYSDYGIGSSGSANFVGWELLPVPEPSSLGMLGGTLLLLARRKRRC